MNPDEIATALRSALRERLFQPGQTLNQDDLARRFGVSRIPLREALRTLVGEGLVSIKPGLGAVVTELSSDEVSELYGLRLQLEPPLAPHIVLHVARRDIDDLARMTEVMAGLADNESEKWSDLNYAFHRRLFELSRRRHTVRLVVQLLNLVAPYARVHAHVLGRRPSMGRLRVSTVEALRANDAERLRALLTDGIEVARAELVAAMGGPGESDVLSRLRSD